MFKSIQEIKEKGELIRKGKIFPRRILKCAKRRLQHKVVAGSNQWAIPTKSGYLLFVENNDGDFRCVIDATGFQPKASIYGLSYPEIPDFIGSPYHSGESCWQGNHGISEVEFISLFNNSFLEMNERG